MCLLCAIAFTLPGCGRLQPMAVPSFDIPVSSPSKVQEAIRTALQARGWAITKVTPGRIDASYRKTGGATANIAVKYSGPHITIEHVDSTGLEYSNTEFGTSIHRTYNNWMVKLQQDIQVAAGGML